jgi:hypothetical protein
MTCGSVESPDRDRLGQGYRVFVTDPTSFSVFTESTRTRPLKDRVVESLRQKGYDPTEDEDGDVAVIVQGQQVFVRTLDTQPPLLRVFGQWLIGQEVPGDVLLRLNAANAVTSALNLVKATVHEDRLVVAVDLVISDGLALPSLMAATLDATVTAVQTWHATVLELARPEGQETSFPPAESLAGTSSPAAEPVQQTGDAPAAPGTGTVSPGLPESGPTVASVSAQESAAVDGEGTEASAADGEGPEGSATDGG